MNQLRFWPLLGTICFMATTRLSAGQAMVLGPFEDHSNIGEVSQPGSVVFDPDAGTYVISGSGENMWFNKDAFHFVWKRLDGNFSLAADVDWLGAGGNAHRKACLLIRANLEPDSQYADAVIHGDGLTSLQFREEAGGITREIQANVSRPKGIRLERDADGVSLSFTQDGQTWESSGCYYRMSFADPVYVGLGVCSHDNKVIEKARFSNVKLAGAISRPFGSTLEVVTIASKDRKAVFHTPNHIEAPNWTPDGKHFLFNSQGRIYRLPVQGGTPEVVETGFANRCNNDHGISFDGKELAISDQSQTKKSLIYVVPIVGGTPRQVSAIGPSYWHGWSPDGKTLVFCGERNNEFDIYSIPAAGGDEQRLTTAPGLDDGPEYTADGRFIYFNSERTGTMQIWRMRPDGSEQQQVTSDDYNNWFAHPSPDGKWLVFLSYAKEVKGHPANQEVTLRLMPLQGGPIQVLARLYGGQGTINVPSWSPDSRQVAFVSYQPPTRP